MSNPDERRHQLLIVEDEPTDALLLLKALWILHKEEASKEMAVWRRLIPWQMSHGVS